MVLERRDRQVEPDHAPDLLRPEAGRVDHMLGVDEALLGDDVPGRVRPLLQFQHAVVLDDLRAALPRRAGVGPDRAGGVDMALAIGPHAAEHAFDIDDRAERLDLVGRDQPDVLDADRLEAAIVAPAAIPSAPGAEAICMPPVTVHADRLPRLGFDLLQEVDRIGLQTGRCSDWR